jgi:hypothetical protein
MASNNRAAYFQKGGKPAVVADAPMPTIRDEEILVKVICACTRPACTIDD